MELFGENRRVVAALAEWFPEPILADAGTSAMI